MNAPGVITVEECEILDKAFDILEALGTAASAGLADVRAKGSVPADDEEREDIRRLRRAESSSLIACMAIDEVLDLALA